MHRRVNLERSYVELVPYHGAQLCSRPENYGRDAGRGRSKESEIADQRIAG